MELGLGSWIRIWIRIKIRIKIRIRYGHGYRYGYRYGHKYEYEYKYGHGYGYRYRYRYTSGYTYRYTYGYTYNLASASTFIISLASWRRWLCRKVSRAIPLTCKGIGSRAGARVRAAGMVMAARVTVRVAVAIIATAAEMGTDRVTDRITITIIDWIGYITARTIMVVTRTVVAVGITNAIKVTKTYGCVRLHFHLHTWLRTQ